MPVRYALTCGSLRLGAKTTPQDSNCRFEKTLPRVREGNAATFILCQSHFFNESDNGGGKPLTALDQVFGDIGSHRERNPLPSGAAAFGLGGEQDSQRPVGAIAALHLGHFEQHRVRRCAGGNLQGPRLAQGWVCDPASSAQPECRGSLASSTSKTRQSESFFTGLVRPENKCSSGLDP